jgi:hypothetical protein
MPVGCSFSYASVLAFLVALGSVGSFTFNVDSCVCFSQLCRLKQLQRGANLQICTFPATEGLVRRVQMKQSTVYEL